MSVKDSSTLDIRELGSCLFLRRPSHKGVELWVKYLKCLKPLDDLMTKSIEEERL